MANHALLVGVRYAARFERLHLGEGGLQARLHLREKIVGEIHAAQIHAKAEGGKFRVMFLEAGPQLLLGKFHTRADFEREGRGFKESFVSNRGRDSPAAHRVAGPW